MSKVTEELNARFNIKKMLIVVLICILLIVALIVTVNILGKPCDRAHNTYTTITINDGDTTEDIATLLKENNIIKDESIFNGLSAVLMKNGKYQSGSYLLSPCMDFDQISSTLINGITTNSGFTIPSGYTTKQTVEALVEAGIMKEEDYDEVINNVDFSQFSFIDASLDKEHQLEGYLFPDKYDVDSSANALMVITTMLDNFDNHYIDEYRARTEELGLTIKDIIIIASIVERSTTIDKEKPLMASVIHNRLNIGMKIKGDYPEYPLCSPGIDSIKAALYPEESDYLYYVKSKKLDGSHEFLLTSEEYIEKYQEYKNAKSKEAK